MTAAIAEATAAIKDIRSWNLEGAQQRLRRPWPSWTQP
jgi:hypothetical protein